MTGPDSLETQLDGRLDQAFQMMDDLVASLTEEDMAKRLSEPSNSIWSQMWCVVGARESYAAAIDAGEWRGFSCSLTADDRHRREPVAEALALSADMARRAIETSGAGRFGLDLLLHESMHQGQLLRYLFGLRLTIPESWRERWSL